MKNRWRVRVWRVVMVVVLVVGTVGSWGSAPRPAAAAPLASDALAWGRNNRGQLGRGSTNPGVPSTNAATVAGLTDLVAVAAGGAHSLALLGDGIVRAWGDNQFGQLGLGSGVTTTNSVTPVTVCASGSGSTCVPLGGVVAIAAGGDAIGAHSLALLGDGTVRAWGDNQFGQLGNGAALPGTGSGTPVPVVGLTNVVAIATHRAHNLALLRDGTVKAWGYNGDGGLGNNDPTGTHSSTPVTVVGVGGTGTLTNVVAIAAGGLHSLALLSDGTVRSWGLNNTGQLGNGSTAGTGQVSPIVVCRSGTNCTPTTGDVFNDVVAIAAGGFHNLALLGDGTVGAWGYNDRGQLGDGFAGINRSNPVRVCASGTGGSCSPLANVAAIAGGGDDSSSHSLALLGDGTVKAWGYNESGQLGGGGGLPGTSSSNPVAVCASGSGGSCVPLANVVAIAGGVSHSVVIRNPSATYGWGAGTFGQLGTGDLANRTVPAPALPTNVVAVAAGIQHSLALLSDGSVRAWGDNQFGQLGNGSAGAGNKGPIPFAVCASGSGANCPRLTNVVAIAAGSYHSLALLGDGTIRAWGRNNSGQLGDGTTTDRSLPVAVCASGSGGGCPALTAVAAIAGGGFTSGTNPATSVAVLLDGSVKSWGFSGNTLPVTIAGLTNAVAVAAGGSTNVALLGDGTVRTWINGSAPIDACVSGGGASCQRLSNVVAVASGFQHRLALRSDGAVYAWGNGPFGQLGIDGGGTFAANPVPVSGLGAGSGVVAIAGGVNHSLALRSDGSVLAWGNWGANNSFGNPTPFTGLTNVVALAGGNNFNLAVRGTPSSLTATTTPPTIPYGSAVTLSATLTATSGGAGLAGQTIRFWLNGQLRCGTGTLPACPVTDASGVATLAGIATTDLPVGSYPIVAQFAGGGDFVPEISAATLTVVKANQTITFDVPGTRLPGDDALTLVASATSGLPVSFSSLTEAVCYDVSFATGPGIAFTGAEGTCTIRARQDGNSNYNAAPPVERSFTVARGNQTIIFDPLANKLTTDAPFFIAAGGSPGTNITFISLTTGVCTASGPDFGRFTVTLTGAAGTCTIRASRAGDLNYNPAPDVERSFAVTAPIPPVALQVRAAGAGGGSVTPLGTTTYPTGQVVTLTASSAAGSVFAGWSLDGTLVSWSSSVTLTMDRAHTVVATFQPLPTFGDVPAGQPHSGPIAQLAARGIINGCDREAVPPLFCPADPTLRHQLAALIVRAIPGWIDETGLPTFTDNTDDVELMTRVATLQRHNVVRGYQAEVCTDQGKTPPCFGPTDSVRHGQALLFVARAMVEKGYWTLQPDDRRIFPDQNGAAGADPNTDQQTRDHRMVVTYVFYVGGVPDVADVRAPFARSSVAAGGWTDEASRAWFSRALWAALDQHFGQDRLP